MFITVRALGIIRTIWLLGRERGRTSYIVVHGHEFSPNRERATQTHTKRWPIVR